MRTFRDETAAAVSLKERNDLKLEALKVFGPSMMVDPIAYDILNEAFGDIPADDLFNVLRKAVLEHENPFIPGILQV